MKLGISSYAYPWSIGVPGYDHARSLTAMQLLERARCLHVPVVQIADNLPLHCLPPTQAEELAEHAARLGLAIEVGTRGIDPPHLRQYLALAQQFGSPILRVVIDGPGGHYTPEAATELLRPQRRAFEQAGVILAIENHDRFPAASLARMVEDLGADWVGICLDTVNSLGAQEGPGVVVDILGPLTVNVHVKDFAIFRPPHMMGFTVEGRPAGRGNLDVRWLLQSLIAHGREFTAVLELWTPPEPSLDLTIQKENRWVQESIEYLAPVINGISQTLQGDGCDSATTTAVGRRRSNSRVGLAILDDDLEIGS